MSITTNSNTIRGYNRRRIVFCTKDEEELLVLEKGKFRFKGKEIKDVKKVYERFCDWLGIVAGTDIYL